MWPIIAVVGALLLFWLWRRRQKRFAAFAVADAVAPWLSARGLEAEAVAFSVFSGPGVTMTPGADVIIVGVSRRRADSVATGFMVELDRFGTVLDGALLYSPGIGMHAKEAARMARIGGPPVMAVLSERSVEALAREGCARS